MRLQLRTGNDRGKVNAKVMARSGTRFSDETRKKYQEECLNLLNLAKCLARKMKLVRKIKWILLRVPGEYFGRCHIKALGMITWVVETE